MAMHRKPLPQLDDRLFLTDGGIETTLLYHDGLDLPDFAAYRLLDDLHGELALLKYFHSYARDRRTTPEPGSCSRPPPGARVRRLGETRLGYDAADLVRRNQSRRASGC